MAVEGDQYHFAYMLKSGNNISQGDVIHKNDEIKEIINIVHPHYLKDDYTYFIVLTQSCDLIRRADKPCNARYITLAAVRPLELVINREILRYQDDFRIAANFCSNSVRFRLEQFLERLFNNNDSEYFYLHKDEELQFPLSSVAFLRLSIALKVDHYDIIFNSRVLSLTDIYKAKIGWLVGSMYSRVGTDEWVPRYATEEEFKQNIRNLLDSACEWVDDKQLKECRELAGDSWRAWDRQTIRDFIRRTIIPSKKEKIIGRVISVLEGLEIISGEDLATKRKLISNTLDNDPTFSSFVKK
ncbi:MAG: hypothetical protein WCF59_04115 [Desulfobaccales bacterium]